MSKKSILTSLILITVGIIFGVILVSNFSTGIDVGFARSGDPVKLGGPKPIPQESASLRAISDNFAAIARAVTPSVVSINVTTSGKSSEKSMPRDFFHFFGPDFKMPEQGPVQGFGSGVIITSDGYIATNNHVVEGADKDGIEVVMHDKERYKAKLVGTDPSTDLAVIKIDARGLRAAALGNSDSVQVGEWAVAIGNPLGLTSTVTAGIISAMGRNIGIINDRDRYNIENFIQTDAAINPGNSGGALVNMSGEVIGINSAIATTNGRYQGYGFAVPVNLLKTVAADLIRTGKVHRGYIGVQIQSVDQTMADALGLKKAEGVLVQGLVKGGAGEAAGIKAGDVILSVDGKEVNEANELQSYIATHHPGDEVTLKLFRDGKTFEKGVRLRPREDEKTVVNASETETEKETPAEEEAKVMKFDNLGFSVRSMTDEERGDLGVDRGVLVTDVKPYSEAFNRFVAKNDVILDADRKEIRTPEDLRSVIEGRKAGDSILLRVQRSGGGANAFIAVQIPK